MAGDVDAQEVALVFEVLDRRERWAGDEFIVGNLLFAAGHEVEKVRLRACFFLRTALAHLEGVFDVGEKLCAILLERRKGPGAREIFKNTLVDDIRGGEAHAKVEHALVGPVGLAFGDDGIGGSLAHALDAAQAIADTQAVARRHKARAGFVHVGQLQLEPHFLRLGHKAGELVEVADFRGNLRAHELRGIVRLHVAGLVGNPGVADGVRLVERIGGERFPVGPNLFDELFGLGFVLPLVDAEGGVFKAALLELGLELIHDIHELFAHRLAQLVALAARETGQETRKKHHLFLVDRDAVGILEVFLHQGVVVGDGLGALLAADEGWDVVHRARAVEGIHRHKIRQALRLEGHEPLLHAVGFELEEAGRFAAAEKLVSFLVVIRDLIGVELDALFLEKCDALLFDGEGLEAEEVHLE